MADFVAHDIFGQKALFVFPALAQSMAARYPACFRWGCQGPDPLFYRRILWGSPLHNVGTRLHSEKTGELFAALATGVQCLNGPAHHMAQAYFYGFLCHYALDSEIHPYVYCYQQQICQANQKLSASAVHCQIEGDMDAALYEQQFHKPITNFDPAMGYQLAPEEQAVLSCLLHAVIQRVYQIDIPPVSLRKALEEMLKWEEFLYQRHPWIYQGAAKVEHWLGRGALLTGHMKYAPPLWDVLNKKHNTWANPWHPQLLRRNSVPELFGLARIRAASLAGQYAAQFDSGILLHLPFPVPFDNGNPKQIKKP